MFRPTLVIIRFFIISDEKPEVIIRFFILSDEKPDDGQGWPKHVVFTIF